MIPYTLWVTTNVFIEGKIEWKRRGGRRRKQLLDDLEAKRRYCDLKEEALDGHIWRTGFDRVYGPIAGQAT
jgi:hypothetical protein